MFDSVQQSPIHRISAKAQATELKSEAEWREAYPVLKDLKPFFTLDKCLDEREDWLASNGKLVAVRHEQKVVAVGALLVSKNIFRGSELLVSALNTLPEFRSFGYGLVIMQYAEALGRSLECDRLILHSGLERDRAHAFYEDKCGMERRGYTFVKDLKAPVSKAPEEGIDLSTLGMKDNEQTSLAGEQP